MAGEPLRATKVKVTWDDILAAREADEGAHEGLLGAAEILLTASNQLVPLDTGELMGSGAVDFDLESKTATVYYDTVYAAKLHQNPTYNFQNGRRGKYLATAFSQGRSRVLETIGQPIKLRFSRRSNRSGV